MGINGRKDEDSSHKSSLEKAQANGFGKEGVAGRKKLDATDKFERAMEDRIDDLIHKSINAIDRAMSSPNTKLASDAAFKFQKTWYNPDQKVIVEGGEQNNTFNILVKHDELNEKEEFLLNKFEKFFKDAAKQEIDGELLEAEVVEEIVVEQENDETTE